MSRADCQDSRVNEVCHVSRVVCDYALTDKRGWSLLALEIGLAGLLKNVDDISKALIKAFKKGLKRAKNQVAGSARREYWHLAPPCPVSLLS